MMKQIKQLLARLASARVSELEIDLASLHDLVADGVLGEYASPAEWRWVAIGLLKEMGVWKKLRNERI